MNDFLGGKGIDLRCEASRDRRKTTTLLFRRSESTRRFLNSFYVAFVAGDRRKVLFFVRDQARSDRGGFEGGPGHHLQLLQSGSDGRNDDASSRRLQRRMIAE